MTIKLGMATAFTVPEMVAKPGVTPAVSVAVYVPSPLSVTRPSVPRSVNNTTVSPPYGKGLPDTSLSWTVMVDVEAPSAGIDVGDPVIVVSAGTAVTKSTVALSPIACPFIVPLIVAVSTTRLDINVAV